MEDDFLSVDEASRLRALASSALALAGPTLPGPSIFDPASGLVRLSGGRLANAWRGVAGSPPLRAPPADLDLYASVLRRIEARVAASWPHALANLTAPSFVSRIIGAEDWRAASVHDQYYHPHADGLNTDHYHYSVLLYLSHFGEDFTGGRLRFYSREPRPGGGGPEGGGSSGDVIIEPRVGRLVMFTSGAENWHRVEPVRAGERFVLSVWLTCDAERAFAPRVDGSAHLDFSGGARLDAGDDPGGEEL